jgi:glucose dehydrogenase
LLVYDKQPPACVPAVFCADKQYVADRRCRRLGHRDVDPDTNQTIWGTGNPVPMFDPTYRPGDNLYTDSAISWDPETGKTNWYFQ